MQNKLEYSYIANIFMSLLFVSQPKHYMLLLPVAFAATSTLGRFLFLLINRLAYFVNLNALTMLSDNQHYSSHVKALSP